MPIYEFECPRCKHRCDRLQKMSDPNPDCPECEPRQNMTKLISACNHELKGSGWYKTDFRNK